MQSDSALDRLLSAARSGRLTRRSALSLGLRLGLATPAIEALVAAAPAEAAPSPHAAAPRRTPRQQSGGTFTVLRSGSSPDIDPHTAYDNLSSMLFLGLYEMLVQYKDDSTSDLAPMLADSWEANADNSVVTFRLAPNVTFHDGATCDAQAVKDAFTRFLGLDTGPVNVLKRFVTDPEQMVVVDPATIRFDLGRPQPLFLPAMASEYGPLITSPQALAENRTDEDPWAHEWFVSNASGTGPYMLAENSPTEQVILDRFDGYRRGWDGNHFDRIAVRIVEEVATLRQLLESGDADASAMNLTPEIVEQLGKNPNLQVITYDSTAVFWAMFNAEKLNLDARRGLCFAFPYDEVESGAYKGLIVRSGPLALSVLGGDPNVYLYETDLDKARELLSGAGFPEGASFEMMIQSGDEVESVLAQLFQANMAKIGYTLDVVEVERGTLVDLVYGDSPASERPDIIGSQGWWPDYNDPWNQLDPNFRDRAEGGIANAGYWRNDRFEEIMAEAEQFTDEAELLNLMQEAQNILTEQDPPAIYYGQLKWYAVLGKDIKGFVPNPLYLNSFPFYRMYREA